MAHPDRGDDADALEVRCVLRRLDLRAARFSASGRRGRNLRRGHLFKLQHVPAAAVVLYARLRTVLPRVRRRDQGHASAVPAGGIDQSRNAEHFIHKRSCGNGGRRRHNPPGDPMGCGYLPESYLSDHGRSDRRFRYSGGHVGIGHGRSESSLRCCAYLAFLYIDESGRHGERQRNGAMRRDEPDMGDQHQRKHHCPAAFGRIAGDRPFGQHE